jgi:uncharacterized protein involved in response to NO
MNTQTKQNYFLSQPHQPFFLLGVVNAIIMMLIFALSYKGILSLAIDIKTFHVYSLTFLLFMNVFTGFLFTTFPRFNQSDVISKKYYVNTFLISSLGSVLFVTGSFISTELTVLGMLVTFVAQLLIVLKLHTIYKSGQAPDKKDSFWILNANYFGLFGNVFFMLSLYVPETLNAAINISFYLYIIFLAFSVGQRMIPFFSHSFAQKNENFVKIIFTLFLAKALLSSLEILYAEILIDLILGVYMLIEFKRWELKPFESPAILWVLHLALFWLPTAFLLSAISLIAEIFLDTSFYFLNTHLLAIGFLTTVLIGFGTRVTLGHSGQPPHGDKLATIIFIFIQVVVIGRALFSLNVAFGWGLDFLFDISFTLWLILFIVWGLRYGKVLVTGAKI